MRERERESESKSKRNKRELKRLWSALNQSTQVDVLFCLLINFIK
jgi:hypothetical protein